MPDWLGLRQEAELLRLSWPEAAGIPETTGHPWWRFWARATIDGEAMAQSELRHRQQVFRPRAV